MKSITGRGLLALLLLIYAVNQLDRQILGIVLPGIRGEFHLSDGELGLLTGPAFALIYVALGIPLGALADRGYRRAVIAGSLGVFSIMTLLCAAAGSFAQLLAARLGVGLGEAGTAPALNAIIAQRFSPQQRTGALSVYSAGANLGLLLAFFGGGLIMQHWGWRAALTAAGIPGLLLMAIFLLSWREDAPVTPAPRMPLGQAIGFLWRRTSFRLLALGSGLTSIGGYSSAAFVPSMLHRSHHLAPVQIGLLLAVAVGVGGFFGTMLPGLLSDRLGKRLDGLTTAALCVALWIPAHLLLCLAAGLPDMIIGLVLAAFLVSAWLGPILAATQAITPEPMRATAAALLLAALNLIGMAAGPLLVGLVSDALKPALGEEALRYALGCTVLPASLAVWCFLAARRPLSQEAL
jgi:MFS family permease